MNTRRREWLSEAGVVKNKSGTGDVCRHDVQAKEGKHDLVDIPEASENKTRDLGSNNKNEEKVTVKCALY